jgi:hypothetical protein
MSCFSLDFWEKLCIFIVIIMGLWAVIKLLLPLVLGQLPSLVVQIIKIVIWVVIAICCIIIIFGLLSCLLGMAGGLFGGGHSSFRSWVLFAAGAPELSLYGSRHWRMLR